MLGGHIAGVDRERTPGVSMDLLTRSGYPVATDSRRTGVFRPLVTSGQEGRPLNDSFKSTTKSRSAEALPPGTVRTAEAYLAELPDQAFNRGGNPAPAATSDR